MIPALMAAAPSVLGGGAAGGGLMSGLSGAAAGAANVGSAMGGVGSLFSGITSLFGGKKKVSAPPPPTGVESGAWANDYYNAAFPGTTPWERLGTSNPSGQVQSATMETNTQARGQDSERKFQYDNMKLDHMSRMMDIALKKSQLDISQQEVDVRKKEYGLKEKLNPSEIQRNRYGSFTSAAKSLYDDNPAAFWSALGFSGLGGAAAGLSRLGGFFKSIKGLKSAKDGAKVWNNPTFKNDLKTYKKNYKNPYSGKKIPD